MKLRRILQFVMKLTHTRFFYPLLLVLIEALIFLTNYTPGSFLIGWDNVMPELNFPLNFQRALVSLWQEYRGLGTLDGMAHAANLMHTLYIWLLSLVLPQSVLRYVFIHLTHLLGGIGMYYLLRSLLSRSSSNEQSESRSDKGTMEKFNNSGSPRASLGRTVSIASFLGTLFYMFNLGVIQMYYAPLEVFAVHFTALPWLTLQIKRTLKYPTVKNFGTLFLLGLLFSPQGFVPTVFLVFLLLLGFLLLFSVLQTRKAKTALLVGLTILLSNAFWLLPFSYSAIKTPETIQRTKINQIASEEIYYRNKAFGDIISVLSLRGFMLATTEYDTKTQKDLYLMQHWLTHTDTLIYRLFFFVIFLVMGVGILQSFRDKDRNMYPFFAVFLICFVFLANNTPGLAEFNGLLRSVFPILGEAFRFPFTKFMTVFAFCFSIFFAYGLGKLITKFSTYARVMLIVLLLGLTYLCLPVFQGYFTSPLLRLHLPTEYLSLFSYFKDKNPDERITLLPMHTFWNWQYRNWNHRGSGFLWYGLPQPILERAFDPWSLTNEQYYNELSAAINREDSKKVEAVLRKYDVAYVLLDESILNTLSREPINFSQLKTFLEHEVGLKKSAQFSALTVYSVPTRASMIAATPLNQVTEVHSNSFTGRTIGVESLTSNYITTNTPNFDPLFSSLATEKLQSDLKFRVTETPDALTISPTTDYPTFPPSPNLRLPSLFATEFLVPVSVEKANGSLIITPLYPAITINGTTLVIPTQPITLRPNVVKNPTTIRFADTDHVFTNTNEPMWTYLLNPYLNTIRLSDAKHEEVLIIDTRRFSSTPMEIPLPWATIDSVAIRIPKIASPFTHQNLISRGVYETKTYGDPLPSVLGQRKASVKKTSAGVDFSVLGAKGELSFYLDNLFHQGSYLMTVDAAYKAGLPINFYVDNTFQHRAELESVLAKDTRKNILIIPQSEQFFKGYGFHFIVKSVGNEPAEATLKDISVYPFPQQFLSEMAFITAAGEPRQVAQPTPLRFSRMTPSAYETVSLPENSLVSLAQAYDPGWKAYRVPDANQQSLTALRRALPFIFGIEVPEHVKVNNWANGWVIGNKPELIIVYLPQYLEYAGLAITLLTLCLLIALLSKSTIVYHRRKHG